MAQGKKSPNAPMTKKAQKQAETAKYKPMLFRCYEKETADLLAKVEKEAKPVMSRNAIINECLVNWLPVMAENIAPAASLSSIFEKNMSAHTRSIKNELDNVKKIIAIIAASLNIDGEALGYLINNVQHIMDCQAIIPKLPEAEVELGAYDKLPKRLTDKKADAIKKLLDKDTD